MEKSKKNKKLNTMLIILVGAFVILGSVFMVDAYRGDYTQKGPNYSEDRHENMENAFENLDYESWYELMTEDGRHPRVVDVITEDNFETFAQIHELREEGNLEKADELRSELGLGTNKYNKEGRNRASHNRYNQRQVGCPFRN